jgi:uncharacterized membrane protein (UPF0127 family)
MRNFILLIVFSVGLIICGAYPLAGPEAQNASGLVRFSQGALTIVSGDKKHEFTVELALSHRQQMQGLMFRRRMAPDAGMLFVYKREEPTAMWMKNTFMPLDMMFIAKDGRIIKIAERTVPMSEATITSGGPVIAVLELNAGTAGRLGIKPGDRILAKALGTGG